MEARARQEASGANWVSWEGLKGTMVTHGRHIVCVSISLSLAWLPTLISSPTSNGIRVNFLMNQQYQHSVSHETAIVTRL